MRKRLLVIVFLAAADYRDSWLHRLHERFDDFVGGAPTPQMMAIQLRETR